MPCLTLWLGNSLNLLIPTGDVTAAEGDTVTLNCSFKTTRASPTLYWYKQEFNDFPKYLLKSLSSTVYHASEIQKDRLDAERKDNWFPLKIQKLQLSDSAVYYCALNNSSLFL
uniref:Ig-like domain-containing protein n=1 Tax=Lates calcarifer TaxID=8187 RepID=A0A4W6CFY7_LATCA